MTTPRSKTREQWLAAAQVYATLAAAAIGDVLPYGDYEGGAGVATPSISARKRYEEMHDQAEWCLYMADFEVLKNEG